MIPAIQEPFNLDTCDYDNETMIKTLKTLGSSFGNFREPTPAQKTNQIPYRERAFYDNFIELHWVHDLLIQRIDSRTSLFFGLESPMAEDINPKAYKHTQAPKPSIVFMSKRGFTLATVLSQNRASSDTTVKFGSQLSRLITKRLYYLRSDGFSLKSCDEDIVLETNPLSHLNIFEPQYITCYYINKKDSFGRIKKVCEEESKCGLCPFCPYVQFFNMSDGSYTEHVAFEHGIDSDSYLFPDPGSPNKADDSPIKTVHCPVCSEIINLHEIQHRTDQQFRNYFKHFKSRHRNNINTKEKGRGILNNECFRRILLERVPPSSECLFKSHE